MLVLSLFGKHTQKENAVLSRCRPLVSMTNGVKLREYENISNVRFKICTTSLSNIVGMT